MEGLIYFFALIPSIGLSLALRALIRWLTARWQSRSVRSWQKVIEAGLRALPWALAFSPVMMTKGGRGVLVPASIYLIALGYGKVFDGTALDTEDVLNVHAALTMMLVIWGVVTLVFFVWRCVARGWSTVTDPKTKTAQKLAGDPETKCAGPRAHEARSPAEVR